MNHDLLSVSEVADALGVTTRTIRNYLSDGKLKGQKDWWTMEIFEIRSVSFYRSVS